MQREFAPAVYLLASRRNGTFYVGVTSDLLGRIYKHFAGMTKWGLGSRFRGNDEVGRLWRLGPRFRGDDGEGA